MKLLLKELPDKSVSMMNEISQTICTFHTMEHAMVFFREWQMSDYEPFSDNMDINGSSGNI